MSRSSGLVPAGSSQSKWYNNWARGSSIFARPNDIPGHILFPAPNGTYWCLFTVKSKELLSNLSGEKLSASFQYPGSLPIAQAFTITSVFMGMRYPLISVCFLHSLSNKGTGGCNLRVSLITNFKYSKPWMWLSSMLFFPLRLVLVRLVLFPSLFDSSPFWHCPFDCSWRCFGSSEKNVL